MTAEMMTYDQTCRLVHVVQHISLDVGRTGDIPIQTRMEITVKESIGDLII
jgi:hypothetical protein